MAGMAGRQPVANIKPRVPAGRQALEVAALRGLNQAHLVSRDHDPLLDARLRTFETAFGMQMAVPEAFDYQEETDATLAGYGLRLPSGGGVVEVLEGGADGLDPDPMQAESEIVGERHEGHLPQHDASRRLQRDGHAGGRAQ